MAARLMPREDGCAGTATSGGYVDWNTFEAAAFWVLAVGPIVILAVTARLVYAKGSGACLAWYFHLGGLLSLAYVFFSGFLVLEIFPPPYVPGLSEGQGLDLRGLALVFGGMVGGVAGFITTLISFGVAKHALAKAKE